MDDTSLDQKRLIVSEWIDGKFGRMFPGSKLGGREQVELWPRINAVDVNGDYIAHDIVPYEVEAATYEGMFLMESTDTSLSVDFTPSEYKRVSIDGALTVEYDTTRSISDVQPRYVLIETLLSSILTNSTAGGAGLSGAAIRA